MQWPWPRKPSARLHPQSRFTVWKRAATVAVHGTRALERCPGRRPRAARLDRTGGTGVLLPSYARADDEAR
jgi:hypothetical protein